MQYLWDINNDGVTDKITTVGRLSYKYTANGTYKAKVTAVDRTGAKAAATATVKLGNGPELYGKIEYYQFNELTKAVRVKARVYNSGNVAAAPSSLALSVSDNGANASVFKTVPVAALAAGKNTLVDVSHTFPASVYGRQIGLAVDSGKKIEEVDETNNGAKIALTPVAASNGLTVMPNAGGSPLSVQFACHAKAATGKIAQYLWDFNGDGTADKITPTGYFNSIYPNPGKYSTQVTVVDNTGHQTQCGRVTVTVANGPELVGKVEYYEFNDAAKTIRVKTRVYNTGNVIAAASNAAYSVSDNGVAASTFKNQAAASLGVRKNVLLDASHTFSESVYGRQITVSLDSGKKVAEVDELNNAAKITIGPAATQ